MNASTQQTTLDYSELPLFAIQPSGSHVQALRRARFTTESIDELAATIGTVGIIEPLLVRPHPAPTDKIRFELVAGERRYLAAGRAGIGTVPCIVREVTDAQVLELQLVENLQREGLAPLEEATGYKELMGLKNIKADAVGDFVGKSRSWVYARLTLLDLPPPAMEALQRGELDASRALMVARIRVPKLQEKALKLATEFGWNGNTQRYSVRDLKEQFDKLGATASLKGAPFALDDATYFRLVPAKINGKRADEVQDLLPCTICPARSGNCSDTPGDDPDVCTDHACFDVKIRQSTERLIKEHEAAGRAVITGDAAKQIAHHGDLDGYIDLDEECPADDYEFSAGKPVRAKGETEEAFNKRDEAWWDAGGDYQERTYRELLQPVASEAITLLQDPKTRRIRQLLPVKLARQELKGRHGMKLGDWIGKITQHSHAADDKPKGESEAAIRAREKAERDETIEQGYRKRLAKEIFTKWGKAQLKLEELVITAELLIDNMYGISDVIRELHGGRIAAAKMKEPELVRLLALITCSTDLEDGYGKPGRLLSLAQRLHIDPKKVRAQVTAELTPHDQNKAPAAAAKKATKTTAKKTSKK